MKGRKTNKFCIVPMCPNTSLNSPNKHFFSLPSDKEVLWLWCRAMNRENLISRKRAICCCEDHFNLKEDTVNNIDHKTTGKRRALRLRNGVIPHRFDCQQQNAKLKTEPQSYVMPVERHVETQMSGEPLKRSDGGQKQVLTPLSQYISLYSLGTNRNAENPPYTEPQGHITTTIPPSNTPGIPLPIDIRSILQTPHIKDNLLSDTDDASIPSDGEDGSVLSDAGRNVMPLDMKDEVVVSDYGLNLQPAVGMLCEEQIKALDVPACDVVKMDHDYNMDRLEETPGYSNGLKVEPHFIEEISSQVGGEDDSVTFKHDVTSEYDEKTMSKGDEETEQSNKRRRLKSEPTDEEYSEMENQPTGNEDGALAIRILKTESLNTEVLIKTESSDSEEMQYEEQRTLKCETTDGKCIEMEMPESSASTTEVQTIKSWRKSNAQKCREYRERKKLQNTMIRNITAVRSDECTDTDLLQDKQPKTNAERRKKHYEAQQLKKQESKKIPKTVKQKNKEYYERKKKLQALNTFNHHSDASRDDCIAKICNSEEIRNNEEETQQDNSLHVSYQQFGNCAPPLHLRDVNFTPLIEVEEININNIAEDQCTENISPQISSDEIPMMNSDSVSAQVPDMPDGVTKTEPIEYEESDQPGIRKRLEFEPDEELSQMQKLQTEPSDGEETQHASKRRRLQCESADGEHIKMEKQRVNIEKSNTTDHKSAIRHEVKISLKQASQTDPIDDDFKRTDPFDEDFQDDDDDDEDYQLPDDDSQSSSDQDELAIAASRKTSIRKRRITSKTVAPPRIKLLTSFSENDTTSPPASASNPTPSGSQPDTTAKILDRRKFDYGSDDDELIFNSLPRAQRILHADVIDSSTTSHQPADETPAPPSTFRPSALFDFKWKPLPASVPKATRREEFIVHSGPTKTYTSPYEVFTEIWDEFIMLHIASETNRYAKELINKLKESNMLSGSKLAYWNKWYDTDADEMFIYFAVLLSMGITVKSDIQEYWTDVADIFETPNFRRYITFDRFQRLSRCLHFNGNDFDISFLSVPEARLYKLEPIVEHLNQRFQELYLMGQNVVLDESLAQWKDRLNSSEYVKSKSKSDGFKSYELCDATNGYLWRFKLHAGPETPSKESPISNFTSDLILQLTSGLEFKGYTLWMDHYYNSPALARVLKSRGIDCVGTLRTNRQFVPNSFAILTKHNMADGELQGCTTGDVDLIVWKNQNRIAMISTYHGLGTLRDSNGVKQPKVFRDYNEIIAAIDKKDRMLAMYPIERKKADIMYKKLFRRLLNISVLNSYIIFKENLYTNLEISHRNFRKALIKEILVKHKPIAIISLTGQSQPSVVFSEEMLKHLPAEYPMADGWQPHSCVLCRKSVQTCCPGCDVALCAIGCFGRYHTKKAG